MGDQEIVFYLRQLLTLNVVDRWNKDLYMYGRTADHKSVSIKVDGFTPYIYMDMPKNGEIDNVIDEINTVARPWTNAPDAIISYTITEKTTLLGFDPSEAYKTENYKGERRRKKYVKLIFRNIADISKLSKIIRETRIQVGPNETQLLEVYHDDSEQETMFLHQHKLKMQSWVRISKSTLSNNFTTSDIDRVAHCTNISIVDKPPVTSPIAPILQCQLRIRAESKSSTPKYLRQPNPENIGDRISDIAVTYRWIGDGAEPKSMMYDDEDEQVLLRRFF